jgi:hypothetical protein
MNTQQIHVFSSIRTEPAEEAQVNQHCKMKHSNKPCLEERRGSEAPRRLDQSPLKAKSARRKIAGLALPAAVWLAAMVTNVVYAQSDVTQPTDAVIASSANSPGSEGVANVIDNGPAKYLNFDGKQNAKPTGFVVTPAVGATRVTGIRIQSANDGPERDPKIVTLEGSNDATITGFNTGTWETIANVTFAEFTERFQNQTIEFENFRPYKHYRWTVIETQSANDCCMQVAEVELLGSTIPGDVTQPTDPAIASSANSPGSEGVANVIDNGPAKYLNFDGKQNAKPTGFVVTPAIGKTLVTGMTIQSANDGPERDPLIVRVEGSNDDTISGFNAGTWAEITTISNIPPFAERFQTQTFLFDNFTPYKHYRWTVFETQSPNDCCMQVAEVELLGTGEPKDVTQPTDPTVASSANSPGSEGVANAIDNGPAKYLNFDGKQNAKPTGFVVTPAIGSTVVIGMTIQSANDGPERDPLNVKIEGSNDDTISGFNSGTWEEVTTINNIPEFTERFQTQAFYFANKKAYKHYRWTVLQTQSPNDCCMQVAEVELLAATQSNPCGQTAFTTQPVDTPTLEGASATFFTKVNGPWTLQWYKNGQAIPGAIAGTYVTDPLTPVNQTNLYSVAIVGCQTSQVVRATLFTPSVTKSVALNFIGGGANGAPTSLTNTDVAGVHQQAYWNNMENASGDGLPLKDSDDNDSVITVSFSSTQTWGSGTGTDDANRRMLNGYLDPRDGTPPTPATVTFENVPAGTYSILLYAVNRPLAFNDSDYFVTGSAISPTIYIRAQNADEYNASPGFIRGAATTPGARSVANYVRFDNLHPDGDGKIVLTARPNSEPGEVPAGTAPLNGVQLLINPPAPVDPPEITGQPANHNVVAGSTVGFQVTASGAGLGYVWRKDNVPLTDDGRITGTHSASLSVANVTGTDAGAYSVVVTNSGGTAVSSSAVLSLYNGQITDRLVAHWKFNETSGTVASNSVAGGSNGELKSPGAGQWVAGQIGNAVNLDGLSQYIVVPNYTKPTTAEAVSAWVRATGTNDSAMVIANAGVPTQQGIRLSQFELGLFGTDGDLRGVIVAGPNPYTTREGTNSPLSLNAWHHIVLTANGKSLAIYRDGQLVGSVEYTGSLTDPTAQCLGIGGILDNAPDDNDPTKVLCENVLTDTPGLWTGQLDDIGIWTRTLGADEITAIYQAGLVGKDLSTVQGAATPATLHATVSGGQIHLTWDQPGRLQSRSALGSGTWTDVPGVVGQSATVNITGGAQFFRIINP